MTNRRLLGSLWHLRDVRDTEALIWKAVDDQLRNMRAHLPEHEREDLASYLFTVAWELHLRYDPESGWSFSRYLYRTCRLRVVDWYRDRFWDTRSPKPELPVSLDAGTRDDPLASPIADVAAHPPADRSSDLVGTLLRRGRRAEGSDEQGGQQDDRRAA